MSSKFDIDSKKIKIVVVISAVLVTTMFIFSFFNHDKKYEIGNDKSSYNIEEDERETLENNEFISEEENSFEIDSSESNKRDNTYEEGELEEVIFVDIIGEVKKPSVVEVGREERLQVAIEKAGGLTETAERKSVNLAQKLVDGAQYIIPSKGGQLVINYSEDARLEENNIEKSNSASGKININTASKEELEKLTGIGETLSQRIIEYREENGGFRSIESIKNVNGIGDKKFEDISRDICVN